ncbi:MAG: PAS domain-containing sensor histidine kinase [Nisaea sp.]|nr:PAS domain-containing sensor histidine kinase [Nisaea sp.]|tara:strand:+ start:1728 stop:3923 length:2196 start_codon:yes stop_codon:yes gene_type:complete
MKIMPLSWLDKINSSRKTVVVLAVFALFSGIGTYTVFAKAGATGPNPDIVLGFMYLNLGLLLIIGLLVSKRLFRIWSQRRQGLAGSQLHTRLVMLFSVIAVIPTIVVAVFSVVLFDFGIRSWFTERIGAAVDASQAVAAAYLEEHRQNITGDALAMAIDLNRQAPFLMARPKQLMKFVQAQAAIRNLTEVVVFETSGKVLAKTGLSLTFDFEPFPETAFQKARNGEVATLTSEVDRVRAIVRLDSFVDAYLYVGRFVDPEILSYIDNTKQATAEYNLLQGKRVDVQITFALIFAIVALLLLFSAIWVGLNLATQLADPVSRLITASEQISEGDLSIRISNTTDIGEFSLLNSAFNRMTHQLEVQRGDLIEAHRIEDERRQFTEAVLGGVSSGVIGLDKDGNINLPNKSGAQLLGLSADEMMNKPLQSIIPEMADLFEMAKLSKKVDTNYFDQIEALIELIRDNRQITLRTRITAEGNQGITNGFVVTFDDITELQSAQRTAAWADVARRIAHEIKNPLTPIQLSAERLKRKYLSAISEERDLFVSLTETISRQVSDIGRMVDEFSSFARMPAAKLAPHDLKLIVKAQVTLQSEANNNVEFSFKIPEEPVVVLCDDHQIRQMITNLIQNSIDSINAKSDEQNNVNGSIQIQISKKSNFCYLEIIDDGIGLPAEISNRLTEPYVTTREKGTGLGLAIVAKIVEDHSGTFKIEDTIVSGSGVVVTVKIPLVETI